MISGAMQLRDLPGLKSWRDHNGIRSYQNGATPGTPKATVETMKTRETHRLGDVAVPTLVVVGDSEIVGSNHIQPAAVFAKRIPNAESKILKGQSHGFFWQAPEATNAWIAEWIRRH